MGIFWGGHYGESPLLVERAAEARKLAGLETTFFAKAAEIFAAPWMLAAKFDFLYPLTRGERPSDLEKSIRYFAALDVLTSGDVEVQRLVTEVFH